MKIGIITISPPSSAPDGHRKCGMRSKSSVSCEKNGKREKGKRTWGKDLGMEVSFEDIDRSSRPPTFCGSSSLYIQSTVCSFANLAYGLSLAWPSGVFALSCCILALCSLLIDARVVGTGKSSVF